MQIGIAASAAYKIRLTDSPAKFSTARLANDLAQHAYLCEVRQQRIRHAQRRQQRIDRNLPVLQRIARHRQRTSGRRKSRHRRRLRQSREIKISRRLPQSSEHQSRLNLTEITILVNSDRSVFLSMTMV
jgi:hypothetical protein